MTKPLRHRDRDEKRIGCLADDLAHGYDKFLYEFPLASAATVASFSRFFAERQLECLHYAGKTSPGTPYHDIITSELLQLAAAYLYLPHTATAAGGVGLVRPHARVYGLLLCYFFFATQPQRAGGSRGQPVQIPIAVHVLEGLASMLEQQPHEKEKKVNGIEAALLGMTTAGLMGSDVALSEAERVAFLSLHKHGAWHVLPQPGAVTELFLTQLINAHERAKAPLVSKNNAANNARGGGGGSSPAWSQRAATRPSASSASSSQVAVMARPLPQDPAFKQQLQAYRRQAAQLGLTG